MNNQKNQSAIVIIGMALITAHSSYGYIDMNTGSYVLQIIIAGFLGAAYTFRVALQKVVKSTVSLFNRLFKRTKP
jgi:hypothetical protein